MKTSKRVDTIVMRLRSNQLISNLYNRVTSSTHNIQLDRYKWTKMTHACVHASPLSSTSTTKWQMSNCYVSISKVQFLNSNQSSSFYVLASYLELGYMCWFPISSIIIQWFCSWKWTSSFMVVRLVLNHVCCPIALRCVTANLILSTIYVYHQKTSAN